MKFSEKKLITKDRLDEIQEEQDWAIAVKYEDWYCGFELLSWLKAERRQRLLIEGAYLHQKERAEGLSNEIEKILGKDE
jgi:hypothetical protein